MKTEKKSTKQSEQLYERASWLKYILLPYKIIITVDSIIGNS